MSLILSDTMSKFTIFTAMRAELTVMAAAEADAQKPGADTLAQGLRYDDAAASLLALWRRAEDNGLMRELSGYLSTTYGG